jgi:hypothetical protein
VRSKVKVREVTLDMAANMGLIVSRCFPKASKAIDRFELATGLGTVLGSANPKSKHLKDPHYGTIGWKIALLIPPKQLPDRYRRTI